VHVALGLDGVLLHGPRRARRTLARWFGEQGAWRHPVYVTGRSLAETRPLVERGRIPPPAFVIADHGATVVRGEALQPVEPLQRRIDRRWPGSEVVAAELRRHPRLVYNIFPGQRRVRAIVDPAARRDETLQRDLVTLGCELVFPGYRQLAVLPWGTSSGATLRALLDELGELDETEVVVVGARREDLTMMKLGTRSIVVGNADPVLVGAVRGRPRAHIAERAGAGGVIEGLARHGLMDG